MFAREKCFRKYKIYWVIFDFTEQGILEKLSLFFLFLSKGETTTTTEGTTTTEVTTTTEGE